MELEVAVNLSLWLLMSATVTGQVPTTYGQPMVVSGPSQQVMEAPVESAPRRGLMGALMDFRDRAFRHPTGSAMSVEQVSPVMQNSKMPVSMPMQTSPIQQVSMQTVQSVPMQSSPMTQNSSVIMSSTPMMQNSSVIMQSMPMQNGQVIMMHDMPMSGQVVSSNPPMPVKDSVTQVTYRTPADQPASNGPEVRKEFQNKVGHAEDYAWITGQLMYAQVNGGIWVVRYATPNEPDQFGGFAILGSGVELRGCKEGDLVSINGQVTGSVKGSSVDGCYYKLSAISLIERAK